MSRSGSKLVGTLGMAVLVLSSTACVGVRVKYIVDPKEDVNGLIKFRLAGSLATIAAKDPSAASKTGLSLTEPREIVFRDGQSNVVAKDDADYFENVAAVATQIAGSREEFAIVPHDWLWQKTRLAHTYIDASDRLLKEVGSEVTDYRKQIIETIGAVAKGAAVGVAVEKPEPKKRLILPIAIEISPAAEKAAWLPLPKNNDADKDDGDQGTGWWYRVVIQRPEDAGIAVTTPTPPRSEHERAARADSAKKDASFPAATFFRTFNNDGGDATRVLPVSACRTALIFFQWATGRPSGAEGPAHLKLTVADPTRVDTVAMPNKGSVKLKPVCGADVESQPSSDASLWQLIQETANQAKAIRDAQKKKQQ